MNRTDTDARLVALLLPLALLAGALGSQYWGGLFPCEMCYWQRWPHGAAAVLAALAFIIPGRHARRSLVALAAVAIAGSGAIAAYHAGVEYGWWEGVTSCTSTVTAGPGSAFDRIMAAPMIRCDVPQWTLAGVSLAGFNALLSLGGAVLILWLLRRPR